MMDFSSTKTIHWISAKSNLIPTVIAAGAFWESEVLILLKSRWQRDGVVWKDSDDGFIIIVAIPWDEDLHKSDVMINVITWWEETFLPGCVEVERPTIVSWSSVALVPSESWWSDEASFSFLIFTCRLRDWQHWQHRCPWREDTIQEGRCIHNWPALKYEGVVKLSSIS